MKGVKVVSFDGLNRSGKGTQLNMLRRDLESELFPTQIFRGDGSREGIGSPSYHDPYSPWWRRWQNNKDKTTQDWDNAYLVLNKELEDGASHFRSSNTSGFILLDRCYLSRWFVERQRDVNSPFENVINRTHVFPDLYFILDAPKEVLLSRQNDDKPKKAEFRRKIVTQWYDLWIDTMDKVQGFLGERMVRLDATRSKDELHKEVLESINVYK